MKIKSREYRSEKDYESIRRLLIECYAINQTMHCWGLERLDWWRFNIRGDDERNGSDAWQKDIRIWETEKGELVGAAHPEGGLRSRQDWGDIFLEVHPDFRQLEEEMLEWAEQHHIRNRPDHVVNWPRKYISLIRETLRKSDISSAMILDLACGTGTLALELAKLGHQVVGVDISPGMIELAEKKTAGLSNASFHVADMLDFTTEETFDSVTCTFDSLNYLLEIEQLRTVFGKVGSLLEPGGFFLFDSNTDQLYLTRHKGIHHREIGDQTIVQKLHYDPDRRVATTIFEFADGSEEVHTQRPYNLDEIEPILEEAELITEQAFSGFQGTPHTHESERLICIARKPK